MARKTILEKDRFTFKLYRRTLPSGQIYYARFYEKDGKMLLADCSTREKDEKRAYTAAGKLLVELQLDKLLRVKSSEFSEKMEGAERLKNIAIVLLSELAAMRRGEIRALRWRNVDLNLYTTIYARYDKNYRQQITNNDR